MCATNNRPVLFLNDKLTTTHHLYPACPVAQHHLSLFIAVQGLCGAMDGSWRSSMGIGSVRVVCVCLAPSLSLVVSVRHPAPPSLCPLPAALLPLPPPLLPSAAQCLTRRLWMCGVQTEQLVTVQVDVSTLVRCVETIGALCVCRGTLTRCTAFVWRVQHPCVLRHAPPLAPACHCRVCMRDCSPPAVGTRCSHRQTAAAGVCACVKRAAFHVFCPIDHHAHVLFCSALQLDESTASVKSLTATVDSLQSAGEARDQRLAALEAAAAAAAAAAPSSTADMSSSATATSSSDASTITVLLARTAMQDLQRRVEAGRSAVQSADGVATAFAAGVTEGGDTSDGPPDLTWCLARLEAMEQKVSPLLRAVEIMQHGLHAKLADAQAAASAGDGAAAHEADLKAAANDVADVTAAAADVLAKGAAARSALYQALGTWGSLAHGATQSHLMDVLGKLLALEARIAEVQGRGGSTAGDAAPLTSSTASHACPAAADLVAVQDALDVLRQEVKQLGAELGLLPEQYAARSRHDTLAASHGELQAQVEQLAKLPRSHGDGGGDGGGGGGGGSVTITQTAADPASAAALQQLRDRIGQQGDQISSLFEKLQRAADRGAGAPPAAAPVQGASSGTPGRPPSAEANAMLDRSIATFRRELDSTGQRLADLLREQATLQSKLQDKASQADVAAVSDRVAGVARQVEPKVDRQAVEDMLNKYMASVDNHIAGSKDDVMARTQSSVSDLRRKFRLQLKTAIERALSGQSTSLTTAFGRRPVMCIACDRPVPTMLPEGAPTPLVTQLPPGRPVTASAVEMDHVRGGGFRVPSRGGSRPGTPGGLSTASMDEPSPMLHQRAAGGPMHPHANALTRHHWEYVTDAVPTHAGYSPVGDAHAPTYAVPVSARGSPHSGRVGSAAADGSPMTGRSTGAGAGAGAGLGGGSRSRPGSGSTVGRAARAKRAASAGTTRRRKPTDLGKWDSEQEGPAVRHTPNSVYRSFVSSSSSHSHTRHSLPGDQHK